MPLGPWRPVLVIRKRALNGRGMRRVQLYVAHRKNVVHLSIRIGTEKNALGGKMA